MHFKLTVKFEMEWIMIMKFNIAIFVFTEKIVRWPVYKI